jgi:D-alanyl-D-alanine dipeptidase
MLQFLDMTQFVKVSDYGIKSQSYYWRNRRRFNISIDELRTAGVEGDEVYVDQLLLKPLKEANAELRASGFELKVMEGYRSPALYKLVYAKRQAYGDGKSTAILNLDKMPHATGRAVDLALIHLSNGREAATRNKNHGLDAIVVDFYKGKKDRASLTYQTRQKLLRNIMEARGFVLGSKKEYWHFEYQPH